MSEEAKESININQYATQYDVKHSTALLESIKFLMYDFKSSKAAITSLTKQVSNALTKEQSFEILLQILPDCSNSILEENAKAWANHAVSKHENEIVAGARFKILIELYKRCHSNQEFHKLIVSNLLPKIIDTCLWVHQKSAEAEHSLSCLYYTMKYFGSTCIVYKKRIEEYVLIYLDISSKTVVTCQAAKCYHMLNQIGGAGPNGAVHIKNFEDSFAKLYKTLHILYNSMFENINEFRERVPIEEDGNYIKFKQIPSYYNTRDVYKLLSRRMENVVIFLIEMLQSDFKVKKTIKPEILEVIQRGLDIHIHGDEHDVYRVIFNQYIQQHQIKLLYLMKALIQSLQQNFMRYTTIKMLIRYLSRVSECTCYNINSFYKSTIYSVIKYWLEYSGEQIDSKLYEKLLELIIKDIIPNKATLVLQINVNNKSGKAKNRKNETKTSIQSTSDNENTPRLIQSQIENCTAALELLELLFKTVHLNVKKTTCTELFNILTGTLLNICVNHINPPYTAKACQLNLFKAFIATFDQTIHTIDIDLAVNILSLAQNRIDDKEVMLLCKNGLKIIEKIVHPIQPTMYLSQEKSTSEQQPVTKSCITVLENLLIQSTNSSNSLTVNETLDSSEGKFVVNSEEPMSHEVNDTSISQPNINTDDNLSLTNQVNNSINGNTKEVIELTEVKQSRKTKKHSANVVEISDNEQEATEEVEISIIEEGDTIPTKKRKADDQEVIYTFDISEDPLDSFVDEII